MRASLAIPSLALAASAHAAVLSFNAEGAVDAAIDVLESFYPHAEPELDQSVSVQLQSENEYIEVEEGLFQMESGKYGKKCILHPVPEGKGEFDDANFYKAVEMCGNGGIISLPDAN